MINFFDRLTFDSQCSQSCIISNKTVFKGYVRAISLKSKTLSISAHHLNSKYNRPEVCSLKLHIWPFKLSPVVFFATDDKDGHGLKLEIVGPTFFTFCYYAYKNHLERIIMFKCSLMKFCLTYSWKLHGCILYMVDSVQLRIELKNQQLSSWHSPVKRSPSGVPVQEQAIIQPTERKSH